MRTRYKTVAGSSVVEFEERKSVFIASVKPADSEDEAIEFINKVKSKYKDATHNVFAYSIAGISFTQKFSDDGEPSGTAGVPVLETIKKAGLENVVIVVTRYFGGTMLGAPGLVRAYGKSASLGIEAAGTRERKLCEEIHISFDYNMIGKIQNALIINGYNIADTEYLKDVTLTIMVPIEDIEAFCRIINDCTNAEADIVFMGKNWV